MAARTGPDDELARETRGRVGAVVMGRKMFSGGDGPWESDPNADGWWGDDPPFHGPVFVLTHHEREPVVKEGGTTFTFVTDGIESALEQARAAAEDRDVQLSGGASVAQQYLQARLLDELHIHVAPTLLGGGVSLFGDLGADAPGLKLTKVAESPFVTPPQLRRGALNRPSPRSAGSRASRSSGRPTASRPTRTR